MNRGMPLPSPQFLSFSGREGSNGHPLIDLDMAADLRRFADYYSGPMIDHKIFANLCSRIDVDSCKTMGIFRHHSGNERDV